MKYSALLTALMAVFVDIKDYFTKKPRYIFVEITPTGWDGSYWATKQLSPNGVYMTVDRSASRDKGEAYATFVYHVTGKPPVQPSEYEILATSDDIEVDGFPR